MRITEIFELQDQLSQDCINDIAQPGSNDEAVYEWLEHLNFDMSKLDARRCLIEQGYDEEEVCKMLLAELKANVLWIAACNEADNRTLFGN